MKEELFCQGGQCSMNTVVYDSEDPEALAPHIVCGECREEAKTDRLRLWLISQIADSSIEDRDLEQIVRLVDHLFGKKKDKALTAAGFYSLTPRQRKKLARQMADEFGPRLPEIRNDG